MTSNQHDLGHEFPEFKDKITTLKTTNNHFARLFDEYHAVNREVIRIEQDVDKVSDQYAEETKKKRLQLKDQLFELLKAAA